MLLKAALLTTLSLLLLQSCQSDSAQETILGKWTTIKASNTVGDVDSTKTSYEFIKDSLIIDNESLRVPVYGAWEIIHDTIIIKNKTSSNKLKIDELTQESFIFSFPFGQDTITTYLKR